MGPRGQLLEDEGEVFSAWREHYLPEQAQGPTRVAAWVLVHTSSL